MAHRLAFYKIVPKLRRQTKGVCTESAMEVSKKAQLIVNGSSLKFLLILWL